MPWPGARLVTAFQTVWSRQPAVRYQPCSPSDADRDSTFASTSFRESTSWKASSCSSTGSWLITAYAYHLHRWTCGQASTSGRYAELDRRDASKALGLLPFLPEEGEGEVDALDLAEPSLVFGPATAAQQIVLDLVEPGQHFRVYGEHRAAQTSVFMLASGTVWSRATAELDLSPVEVFLKFGPLGVSDRLVLIC